MARLSGLFGLALRSLARHSGGQATVEYLLMLAMIAGVLLVSVPLFYKNILGVFFYIIGKVLG